MQSDPVETGDVLVADLERVGFMRRGTIPADPAVVGIVVREPALLLGRREEGAGEPEQDRRVPIAFSGIVPCSVDAGYGAIEVGDLLTVSPTPGHAMRANEPAPGSIVGKALEPLHTGTGQIRVLVMLR